MDDLLNIAGRVALITGGARGIGAATAKLLALHGADIIILDLKRTDESDRTLRAVQQAGRRALLIEADVSQTEKVAQVCREAEKTMGPVDILVNNAGIARSNTMADITEADWDAVIDVNLKGVYNTCKALVPGMMERGYGRVVNLSSIAGRRGSLFGDVHYSSAKAGVIGFTKCLARIAGPRGVLCNAVAPGIVKTDILSAEHEAQSQANIPLGRTGRAEEIAAAILFLCSPMSSYITGMVMDVNGGSYM